MLLTCQLLDVVGMIVLVEEVRLLWLHRTVHGLLIGVCLHVTVQVSRLRKSQVTYFTSVRFLSAMYSFVLGKSRSVSKTLAAEVTSIWSLTRVSA